MTLHNESVKNTVGVASAVAGFGFRAEATVASLRSALQAAYAPSKSATAPLPVLTALATAEDKAKHPALIELARELALPLLAVPLARLTELTATALIPAGNRIPERYGARSVSESSALVAAGLGAHLLAPRAVSADKMATASIAITATLVYNPNPSRP